MFGSGDILPSYLAWELVTAVIYVLFLVVSMLFLFLVLHKVRVERRERKKNTLIEEYRLILKGYLDRDGKLDLRLPRSPLEFDALSDVCIELMREKRYADEKIKEVLLITKTVDYYRDMSASTSWLKRFYAIEKLGFFKLRDLRDYYREILSTEERPEVKAKVIWALSMISDRESLQVIVKGLSEGPLLSSKFNEFIFSNVIESLREVGEEAAYLELLDKIMNDTSVNDVIKRDMIEAAGTAGLTESVPLMIKYFNQYREKTPMRVACIRAIGKIGSSSGCGVIKEGLRSEDWLQRVTAAKVAHNCPDRETAELLKPLLYDEHYYVRINAAKSLARMGPRGEEILRTEAGSEDRFVRDTIRYILQEGRPVNG